MSFKRTGTKRHRGRRGVCEQRSREQCEPQRECERFVVWQTSAASQRQTELCRRDGDLSLSTLRGEGHSAVREKRSADLSPQVCCFAKKAWEFCEGATVVRTFLRDKSRAPFCGRSAACLKPQRVA